MANLPKTNSSPEISDAESEVANPSSPPSNHLQSHRHLRVNNVNSSFNTTIPPPPPSCAACREKLMMRRLHKQLQALEAMVPPTSRVMICHYFKGKKHLREREGERERKN